MNRFTLPLLTLGLLLAAVFCWAAEPQPPKSSDDDAAQLKALQDERINLLTQMVEVKTEQYRTGTADFFQVCAAQNDLYNALLDSTDEPEKRVALLTKQLEMANDFAKLMENRFRIKAINLGDVNRAKVLCLDIKIKLLRERSGNRPPTPTPPAKQP